MKDIQTILQNRQVTQEVAPAPLTAEQKDSLAFFFMRLKLVYGPLYDSAIPDETTERFVKREYGRHVADLTREQISKGFDRLHQLRQGASWEQWRYMDIDRVVGLIKNGDSGEASDWEHARIKAADRERRAERLLPDLGARERAEMAREEAMKAIRSKLRGKP